MKFTLKTFFLFAICSVPAAFAQEFKSSTAYNEVAATLHTFWTFFEAPERTEIDYLEKNLPAFMELFVDQGLSFKTASGEGRNKKELAAYLSRIPGEQKNSHELKNLNVAVLSNGDYEFNAVLFNQTILVDGSRRSSSIRYQGVMVPRHPQLPQIKKFKLMAVPDDQTAFRDVYLENKLKAKIYQWYALFDRMDGNAGPYLSLLGDQGFTINTNSATHTDWSSFENWIQSIPGKAARNAHHLKLDDIHIRQRVDGTWGVSSDLVWSSESLTGVVRHFNVHHEWRWSPEMRLTHYYPLVIRSESTVIPFNDYDFKSFVNYYYGNYDRGLPAQWMDQVYPSEEVSVILGSHFHFTRREDYKNWYAKSRAVMKTLSHEVLEVSPGVPVPGEENVFLVKTRVRWFGERMDGVKVDNQAPIEWKIKVQANSPLPQILEYRVIQ